MPRLEHLVEEETQERQKGMAFPGVQKSTWTYDAQARAYCYHPFYDFQPDLNTSHPEVQAEILKIMGFWIQLGVSGFRVDAVPFVISTKGSSVVRPEEQYDMLRSLREFLQWRQGDCILLAEANGLPRELCNEHLHQALKDDLADMADTQPLQRTGPRLDCAAAPSDTHSGVLPPWLQNEPFILRLATANYLERPLSCGSRAPQFGDPIPPQGR